jgi:hypothetical protein
VTAMHTMTSAEGPSLAELISERVVKPDKVRIYVRKVEPDGKIGTVPHSSKTYSVMRLVQEWTRRRAYSGSTPYCSCPLHGVRGQGVVFY